MTFTEIQYFIDVAELLSFTKAAEKNFVAHQVISKEIRKLEGELGFLLFERNKRQLSLSEAGKMLYQFWTETLKKQEQVIKKASETMDRKKQVLRVGCVFASAVYDVITEAVSEASNLGFGKQFQVESGSYKALSKRLMEGDLDCIISLSDENHTLPDGFTEEVLDCWRPYVIMSRNHVLNKPDFDFRELKDTTMFVMSENFALNAERNVLKCCRHHGFIPEKIREFNDLSGLEIALYEGSGVTVTYPGFFRNPSGSLVAFPISDEISEDNCLTVAYHRKNHKELSLFIQVLKERIHLVAGGLPKRCCE